MKVINKVDYSNYKTLAGKAHYVSGGMKGPSFDIS